MTLEVLVCTIDNGIHNVKHLLLAPIEGVRYLISWQHSDGFTSSAIPAELVRDDVRVVHLEGRGLSRNRNNALRHATSDILVIADDDCTYRAEYLAEVTDTFEQNQHLDIATFQMQNSFAQKAYPKHSFSLKRYAKGYYVSSIEIAMRRTSVQGKLWFDERFGLGAPVLQSCEENLFIHDTVKMGLNCHYFPKTIVEHHHPTTSSTSISSPGMIKAEGAYISIAYPLTCLPRLLLKAHRLNRANHLGFTTNLTHLIQGIKYLKEKE